MVSPLQGHASPLSSPPTTRGMALVTLFALRFFNGICSDKDCETHFGENDHTGRTGEAQEGAEQEIAKEEKFNATINTALEKVKWPLHSEMIATLLDIVLDITGAPNLDWIIFIAGVLVCLYWLRALRLAREGARAFLLNVVLAVLVFLFGQAFIPTLHLQDPRGANLICIVVALAVFYRKGGRRSRHIPAAVKRAVIARDLKGEKYDGKKKHRRSRVGFFKLGKPYY
jgi:hypothetical protein